EIDQHMRVIYGLHLHRMSRHHALGDSYACQGGNALGGTKQSGERGDVVDAQVEERAAAALIEPLRPIGSGPTVDGPCRERPADTTRLNLAPECLVGGAENYVRRTEQQAGTSLGDGQELRGLLQSDRHRFLYQHMLAA